jgi:hypothetical protein
VSVELLGLLGFEYRGNLIIANKNFVKFYVAFSWKNGSMVEKKKRKKLSLPHTFMKAVLKY